jgi:transposase
MTYIELPNDIDALKDLVIDKHREVVAREQVIASRDEVIASRDEQIKELQSQIAFFKHRLFGRRSEKIDPQQLLLFKELQAKLAALTNSEPQTVKEHTRVKGHGRKPIPDDLPTEDARYEPESTACPCCNDAMTSIGEEVTNELDYNPGSYFCRRHVRPKYACRKCEEGVVIAPMPPRPIDKGIAGPGLLAYVLTSKYADHLPLTRLRGMMRRSRIDIHVSTMCDWVARMADLLMPICENLRSQLVAGRQVQSDATEVPYLLKSDQKKAAKGYLWTYLCESSRLVLYDFTTSQERAGPSRFLNGFSGTLLTDGHASYNEIVEKAGLLRAGCWSHARRKYYDARADDRRRCGLMLKLIQELFAIERCAKESRGNGTGSSEIFGDAEHLALRQKQSAALIDKIRECVDEWTLTVLPRSSVGKAVTYMRNQWDTLTVFQNDPTLAIHNNLSEQSLRHVVVGRKNWTFAGSAAGGHRAAVIYSLIGTCKANGLDPFTYLRDVIDRLPRGEDPATITPANWKTAQLSQKPD